MSKKIKFLGFFTLAVWLFAYTWVFLFTPIESSQGLVQKIMYLHVPAILTAYVAILIVCVASLGYLITKKPTYDIINKVSAEQAVLYLAIALVSGAIWGKPTWNTYWTWDARLTITLITFILFCGCVLFRLLSPIGGRQAKSAAVIGILGFLAVPLNHMAVNWFNTLHQKTTIFRKKPLIDAELYYPLLACLGAFLLAYLWLACLRFLIEYKKRDVLGSTTY